MDIFDSLKTVARVEKERQKLQEYIGQGLVGKAQAAAGKVVQGVGNIGQSITGKSNKLQDKGAQIQATGYGNQNARQGEQNTLAQTKQQQQTTTNNAEGSLQGQKIANQDNNQPTAAPSKNDVKLLTGFFKGAGKDVYTKIEELAGVNQQGGDEQSNDQSNGEQIANEQISSASGSFV